MNLPPLTENPSKEEARTFVKAVLAQLPISPTIKFTQNGLFELEKAIMRYGLAMATMSNYPDSVLRQRAVTVFFRAIETLEVGTRCDYFNTGFRVFIFSFFEALGSIGGYLDYEQFLWMVEQMIRLRDQMITTTNRNREELTSRMERFEAAVQQLPDLPSFTEAMDSARDNFLRHLNYCAQSDLMCETFEPLSRSLVDLVGTVEKEMT